MAGIAERLPAPPSPPPADPKLLSEATGNARVAAAAGIAARTEISTTDDVVTGVATTGTAGAIARTQGLAAELVRAETKLQIAQDAFAAIDLIYAGMQELAERALNEDLTEGERAILNAAFQELIQNIGDIIEATIFDGGPILKGGDGSDSAHLIRLSASAKSGLPVDILIPAVSVTDIVDGGENADLRTVDSARLVTARSEKAKDAFPLRDHMIELQRAALQRIFASEIDSDRSLSDYVGPVEPAEYAEPLSRRVSEIVLAGGDLPFEMSADRMRDVLLQSRYDTPARVTVTHAGAPQAEQFGFRAGLDHSPEIRQRAALPAAPVVGDSSRRRGLTEAVPTGLRSGPPDRAILDDDIQALKFSGDAPAQAIERQDNEIRSGGDGRDVAVPSSLVGEPSPGQAGATNAVPEAGLAARENIELGITQVAQPLDRTVDRRGPGYQPLSTAIPGEVSAGLIVTARSNSNAASIPLSMPISMSSAIKAGGATPTAAAQTVVDRPADSALDQSVAAALELNQARNQATAELRQTELLKIGELDSSRRASGLVHQYRESDTRPEAGLTIVKTVYEAPADEIQEFGASVFVEPGGFMAELMRTDDMLRVADIAIEQIDLHLDYMRGLAEEAAAQASRDRIALDEIFQAVKSNIVDTLAQTTEARGEKILSGGDGPRGEYVIRLSLGGAAEESHDIAIPSMRIKDLSPDLFVADIRTRDAAMASADHIELAGADAAQTRDMIAEERTLIRRLMSLEIAQNGSRRK